MRLTCAVLIVDKIEDHKNGTTSIWFVDPEDRLREACHIRFATLKPLPAKVGDAFGLELKKLSSLP